jgi:hypothetical protein
MTIRRLTLSALLLLVCLSAIAQTAPTGRVLLPVVATNVPGAFGSQWTTDIVVINNSANGAGIAYSLTCLVTCGSGVGLAPGQILDVTNASTRPGVPTLFLYYYLQDPSRDNIQVAVRARDLSHQANSWGAEVPVVRDADAFTRPFDLLNVPLIPRFRQTLRVYDLAATVSSSVKVQYFSMTTGALLKENDLPVILPIGLPALPSAPAYAEVGFSGGAPEFAGVDRIRVRIVPTNDAQRLWGMISVTNNDTQELTIISPQ